MVLPEIQSGREILFDGDAELRWVGRVTKFAQRRDFSDDLSYAVIGKAMLVHRELGPGLDEVFYHELLSERMREAGLEHLSRPRQQLVHRGLAADLFEPDLVFPDRLVAELKCLRGAFAPDNFTQLICDLKFWRIGVGLLLDFGKESLFYRRIEYTPVAMPPLELTGLMEILPEFAEDRSLAQAICASLIRLGHAYGLGYRDTTYRGLLAADLTAERVGCVVKPEAAVRVQGRLMGQAPCECVAVNNRCAVMVLALRDEISAADRAILQTYLRLLDRTWGLIVNFGKSHFEHRWVVRQPASVPAAKP